jgi:hypothetical protein
MHVTIKKADGSSEFFKAEKLRRSLRRSGASANEVNKILGDIYDVLHDGMKTQEIYRHAFQLLKESRSPAATRYSLRRALFSLGPTGFPFEKFLARLFELDGYVTETGLSLIGHCATHEIDVGAYKEDHTFIAEAKFHARPGIKSDLQVAMYSYARYLDLKGSKICRADVCGIKEFWLITNTKFTTSAEAYANCMGIKLLSWDFPKHDNLHDRIQRSRTYPITVLQSLSAIQAESLISQNIILCEDIIQNEKLLQHLHLTKRNYSDLMTEVRAVCQSD